MAAPPSESTCADTDCGPNGVCVVREHEGGAVGAECHCDLGYRADGQGHCVDDPADDAELACLAVDCGANIACMATSDAVTCRCTGGGQVVLGGGADGGFGPVCSTPPNPATACGPDACGPYGSCVISQAIFCDCDEGSTQMDATGPDGKPHPYCVRPGEPVPIGDGGAARDGGTADAAIVPAAEAGTGLPGSDDVTQGGGCQLTQAPDIFHGQVLWEIVALGAFWARRRKGSAILQSRCSN